MSREDELDQRIEAHLSQATGLPAEVLRIEPLIGGACQENFRVDVRLGDEERRLVFRHDAASSLGGSIDRQREHAVIAAAVEAGVQTPAARWPAQGLLGTRGWGYFLDWIGGTAIGRHVVRNDELRAAREQLPRVLAENLARIHTITPETHAHLPIGALGASYDGDPVGSALRGLRGMMDQLVEPHPALELALWWLTEERAEAAETTLVHGDFRTGNFMVSPEGLAGILDWEFAHWGVPAEDIAWLCVRDWRFGRNELPAGGFARRDTFYAEYERASGRAVDPADVLWWEVLGNARWAVGCALQAERYLSGKQRDLELLAIGRRIAEMEYEALRLVGSTGAFG